LLDEQIPAVRGNELDKFSKKDEDAMTVASLKEPLRVYGKTRWPLMNDEWRKHQLASMLRMGARRFKTYWDGEETAVSHPHEIERIDSLMGRKASHDDTEQDRVLAARIAALEAQLAEVRSLLASDAMADGSEAPRGDRRGTHRQGRRASDRG
jgi:hypothetical protein|tara:strand:+ start:365 stop:823 length:459 start_codon:yes stop_codon:yes gene_type:complete